MIDLIHDEWVAHQNSEFKPPMTGEVIPRRFLGNFTADFCSDDLLTLSTPTPPQLTQF
jgi:hypothetical protein